MSASRGPEAPPPPPPRGGEGSPVPSLSACIALTASACLLTWLALLVVAPETGAVPALALGVALGLGGLGTVAARAVPAPAERRLGLVAPDPRDLRGLLLLLPLPLVLSELDNVVALFLEKPAAAQASAAGAPARDALATLEWSLLLVGLRPVVEEFFFRGVLLQGLVSAFGSARGVLLDALLFGALRAALWIASPYAAASLGAQAFVEGLVLALLRLATGSLVPGIALQALLAALGMAAVSWSGAPQVAGFNAEGAHTPPEILVPALLAVGAGAALLVRAARRAPPLPPIPREPPRADA